jgi:hypothetical protein
MTHPWPRTLLAQEKRWIPCNSSRSLKFQPEHDTIIRVETILLIAAEWQFRALVRAQLLEEGYEVQALPDLKVALFHLERGGPRPRLAIVDLKGLKVEVDDIARLWKLAEQAPLLLCGGLLDRGLLDRDGMPPARLRVRPFSVGDVVAEVRRMGIWPQADRTGT